MKHKKLIVTTVQRLGHPLGVCTCGNVVYSKNGHQVGQFLICPPCWYGPAFTDDGSVVTRPERSVLQ